MTNRDYIPTLLALIRAASDSRSLNINFKHPTPDELASISFIEGLGKGQMISRQGLASPYLGDIQLSLCDQRGNLEVDVIRARNLQAKANKIVPRKLNFAPARVRWASVLA